MPAVQRTPIDPSRVVCLGPLPENVQLQITQQTAPAVPRIVMPDGRTVVPSSGDVSPQDTPSSPDSPRGNRRGSVDSLGSNFTVDEENRIRGETARERSVRQPGSTEGEGDYPRSPHSMERIEAGFELVHVPQVAEKRYSWEEERTT